MSGALSSLHPSVFDQAQLKMDDFFVYEDEPETSPWFKLENEPLPGVEFARSGPSDSSLISSQDVGEVNQIPLFNSEESSFGLNFQLATNATQSAAQLRSQCQPAISPQYIDPQNLQQRPVHCAPSPYLFPSQSNGVFNPIQFGLNQHVKVEPAQKIDQSQALPMMSELGPQLQQLSNTLSTIMQSTMTNPNLMTLQQQHLIPLCHLFGQFQQLFKAQLVSSALQSVPKEQIVKKKKHSVEKQTRPKVVEAKGAVQCKGRNRKKGSQCRNAALMEYIGPRPIYCAEHIELDPNCLYQKCKSSFQKEPNDNKGCKEVVLKEFGYCYKHYIDLVNQLVAQQDFARIQHHQTRIGELLTQLEQEVAAAKKKDGDLYQRKSKLIPKFQQMKLIASRAIGSTDATSSPLLNDFGGVQNEVMCLPSLSEKDCIFGESSSESDLSEEDIIW